MPIAVTLISAGATVLDANTDGLYIQTSDQAKTDAIVAHWCQQMDCADLYSVPLKFEAKPKRCDLFISEKVNNYAVLANGEWELKGSEWNDPGRHKPKIIVKAVLDYFKDGTPVEQTIRQHADMYDFAQSLSAKKATRYQGKPLQKRNRIYFTTDPVDRIIEVKRTKSGEKILNLTVADEVLTTRPCNRITGLADDIDYDYYIRKAHAIIAHYTGEKLEEPAPPQPSVYLTLMDNRYGKFPDSEWGTWEDALKILGKRLITKDKASQRAFNFWQYNPGSKGRGQNNALSLSAAVFDFDNERQDHQISIAEAEELFRDYEYFLYTSISHKKKKWVDGNLVELGVQDEEGIDRFRVIIPFEEPCPKSVVPMLNKHLRALCQNKAAGESYAATQPFFRFSYLKGCKNDAFYSSHRRGKFLDWKSFKSPHQPRSTRKSNKNSDAKQPIHQLDIVGLLSHLGLAPEVSERGGWHNNARCVWHDCGHHHSTGDDRMAFLVNEASEDGLFEWGIKCNHGGHGGWGGPFGTSEFLTFVKLRWGQDVIDQFCPQPEAVHISPDHIESELDLARQKDDVPASLEDCFFKDTHNLQIQSSTGAGKTHFTIARVLQCINEQTPWAVVVSNKEQQRLIAERLRIHIGDQAMDACGFDIIEAERSIVVGTLRSRPMPRQTSFGILVHSHYLVRRGFSREYYAIMKFWSQHKPLTIIDEADDFVDGCTVSYDLGDRYRGMKRETMEGKVTINGIRTAHCLIKERAGNCTQCHMGSHTHYVGLNSHHIPDWRFEVDLRQGKIVEPHPQIEIAPLIVDRRFYHNDYIHQLKQTPLGEVSKMDFDDESDTIDYNVNAIFQDLIASSFAPTVHEYTPTLNGAPISPDEIREQFIQRNDQGRMELIRTLGQELAFPKLTCKVKRAVFMDRRPLHYIHQHASRLIMLSASYTDVSHAFIQHCVPSVVRIDLPTAPTRQMDSVIVLGLMDRLKDDWWECVQAGEIEPFLIFEETKDKADVLRSKIDHLRQGEFEICHAKSSREKLVGDDSRQHYDAILSYSRSVIGRGVDFKDIRIVIGSVQNYKPTCAFNVNDFDHLASIIAQNAISIVKQNVGRIFRKHEGTEKHCVVLVHGFESGIGSKTFETLVEEINKVSPKVQAHLYPEWITSRMLYHAILKAQNDADLVKIDEPWLCQEIDRLIASGMALAEVKEEINYKRLRESLSLNGLAAVEARLQSLKQKRGPKAGSKMEEWKDKIQRMIDEPRRVEDIKRQIRGWTKDKSSREDLTAFLEESTEPAEITGEDN